VARCAHRHRDGLAADADLQRLLDGDEILLGDAAGKAKSVDAARRVRRGLHGLAGHASKRTFSAASPYAPLGAPRISYASPPYSGALALKLAVKKLDGGEVDKLTVLPLPLVTNETIKLCQEGTWQEMKDGCNAFPPSIVTNPGWFASIFSEETPEVGFNAALVGQPEL
jgi:hypothetical protein